VWDYDIFVLVGQNTCKRQFLEAFAGSSVAFYGVAALQALIIQELTMAGLILNPQN
jgi:hypothetical protein